MTKNVPFKGGYAFVEVAISGKFLYFPLNFVISLKLLKIYSPLEKDIFKKYNINI